MELEERIEALLAVGRVGAVAAVGADAAVLAGEARVEEVCVIAGRADGGVDAYLAVRAAVATGLRAGIHDGTRFAVAVLAVREGADGVEHALSREVVHCVEHRRQAALKAGSVEVAEGANSAVANAR